jgi:pyrroline-5-carboxylate reductase
MASTERIRVGFLGAGRMATALAEGWKQAGLVAAGDCLACDVLESARDHFTKTTGFEATSDPTKVILGSDIVVLAVKPQSLRDLMELVGSHLGSKKLVLSIIAGATLDRLQKALGHGRVVRIMPNTPCMVGASATAYATGPGATAEDAQIVSRLFNAVGRAFVVPEHLMDAVTGLSGSGPAYGFVMIEALADGGVKAGLPRDVATILAAQTLLGAAKMVLETGRHPGQLKDDVASPAGTTIQGLFELEQAGIRGALIQAVDAAAKRSAELGKQ